MNPTSDTPNRVSYPHTLGSIIFWALIRGALLMVVSLWLHDYARWIDYGVWWMVTVGAIGVVVGYPAQLQYRAYVERSKRVISGTLCSTCKHFEPGAVMCSILDEHVSENVIPCEGLQWEPMPAEGSEA